MARACSIAIIVAALSVWPAWAQQPDPHAGHHPAIAAAPAPSKGEEEAKHHDPHHCPMMKDHMASEKGEADAGKGAGHDPSPPAKAADGGMMKGGMMHDCMAMDPAGPKDEHEHP